MLLKETYINLPKLVLEIGLALLISVYIIWLYTRNILFIQKIYSVYYIITLSKIICYGFLFSRVPTYPVFW